MSLSENTQLTQAATFNTGNIVFSKPVVSNLPNSTLTYKRIMLSMRNPDGTVGDLVMSTERLFSFGINTRNPDGNVKDGYQMSLSMHSKEPTAAELKWISVFEEIIEKCKQHLLDIKDDLGMYELSKDDSMLKGLGNSLKYKRGDRGKIVEGSSPILSVKLIERKGEIITLFSDEAGNRVDPLSLFKKHCNVKAVVKFDSIFIGAKLLSMQIKLYEVQVKMIESGFKSLLAPAKSAENVVTVSESDTGSPFDDDIII